SYYLLRFSHTWHREAMVILQSSHISKYVTRLNAVSTHLRERSGVFMQEQRRSSYSYRSAKRRHFSPVALIVAMVPFVLVLLLYTRAWDAAPRFAFPWDAAQWFASLKPITAHTAQPARPTFSRSWYIDGPVASK